MCLIDGSYNGYKTDGTKLFNMNHWGNYNYGGWRGCDARYDILGSTDVPPQNYGAAKTSGNVGYDASATCATKPVANTLMAALPSELRAVMKPITKYSDNVGGGSGNVEGNISASVDYLPLLAEFEIYGVRAYANSYEQNKQVQYTYYANGNSKAKFRHNQPTTSAFAFARSPRYLNFNTFCGVGSSGGSASNNNANNSRALAPDFANSQKE